MASQNPSLCSSEINAVSKVCGAPCCDRIICRFPSSCRCCNLTQLSSRIVKQDSQRRHRSHSAANSQCTDLERCQKENLSHKSVELERVCRALETPEKNVEFSLCAESRTDCCESENVDIFFYLDSLLRYSISRISLWLGFGCFLSCSKGVAYPLLPKMFAKNKFSGNPFRLPPISRKFSTCIFLFGLCFLSLNVRASEFPDRECCDSAPPPPPFYHTSSSTTPVPPGGVARGSPEHKYHRSSSTLAPVPAVGSSDTIYSSGTGHYYGSSTGLEEGGGYGQQVYGSPDQIYDNTDDNRQIVIGGGDIGVSGTYGGGRGVYGTQYGIGSGNTFTAVRVIGTDDYRKGYKAPPLDPVGKGKGFQSFFFCVFWISLSVRHLNSYKQSFFHDALHFRCIKLKSSQATYPTSNAKSLACDTANEHALTCTREACSCSQTAVQWNQWR